MVGNLFCRTNYLLVKQGVDWVFNTESKFYDDYREKLFTDGDPTLPIKFDDSVDIQSSDEDIIDIMDIILPAVIGLPSFAALFSGIMTFTEDSFGNLIADFVSHGRDTQSQLNKRFGIFDLSHGYIRSLRSTAEIISFFTDLFVNGFGHTVNGQDNLLTPNREAFLNEYFELYRPIESLDFEEAVSIFIEDFAVEILDLNTKNRKAYNGLEQIYNFLVKKADATVDTMFGPHGVYASYDKGRAKKQVRDFIRIFLESPMEGNDDHARDIPGRLRSIFRSGTDSYILLDPGAKYGRIYSDNPIFDDKVKIPISYDELIEFLSSSSDSLFVIQTAYSNLDFFKYWENKGEDVREKMINAFNKYMAVFTRNNMKRYFDREFTIHFLMDGGMGVTSYNTIDRRFSELNSFAVEFTPNNPTELRNAIATMLTYQLLFPDTFANIKLPRSRLQFIYSDLFQVHMPEYVQPKLGGTFMWDGRLNALTREAYEAFAASFNNANIFDLSDQRFALSFSTPFGTILNEFAQMFQEEFGEEFIIKNLMD